MKTLVLDCSVSVAWCFEDEFSGLPASVLSGLKNGEAVVPAHWVFEMANALWVGERRGRLEEADITRFMEMLKALPIRIEPATMEHLFSVVLPLAREQKLSVYDAAYLDIAMRLGVPLATLDKTLKDRARRLGIQLV